MIVNFKDAEMYETFSYPGGELQVRLTEQGVTKLSTTNDPIDIMVRIRNSQDVMEMALLCDAIHSVTSTFRTITLILPYMPYGRADRRFTKGDCHGIGVFGGIINSLYLNGVVTLDAHSHITAEQVETLIEFEADSFIDKAFSDFSKQYAQPIIMFPDEGAYKRYTKKEGYSYVFSSKKRNEVTGKFEGFTVPEWIGEAPKQPFIIVDDICDGGGTFLGLANKLKEAGHTGPLGLYVTHGIFSKGVEELKKYFNAIYTTNSFTKEMPEGVVVFDCEELLVY